MKASTKATHDQDLFTVWMSHEDGAGESFLVSVPFDVRVRDRISRFFLFSIFFKDEFLLHFKWEKMSFCFPIYLSDSKWASMPCLLRV